MENLKSKNKKMRLTREKLLLSSEFWEENIRTELFNVIQEYMDMNNLTRTQLAEKVGCSKGYITQVLNGDSDHRISKLVELSIAIGKAPYIYFKDIDHVINLDRNGESVYIEFEQLESKAKKFDSIHKKEKYLILKPALKKSK